MTSKRQNPKSTKTVKKMAMLAGSMAAVGTMQANSQAAVQYTDASASPIGISIWDHSGGDTVGWDIDGDGTDDGTWRLNVSSTTSESETSYRSITIGPAASAQLWFATTNSQINPLANSDIVGPNLLGAGDLSTVELLSYTYSSSSGDLNLGSHASNNLNWGDNYIGFKFEKDGNTHYGWANLNLDQGTNFNGTAAFTEWAWEDTAGTDIHVPDTGTPQGGPVVPEPSSLALLALGAGGLFTYRARQKKLSADRSAEVTA